MANNICMVCGKEVSMLSSKVNLSDGVVCAACLKKAGLEGFSRGRTYSTASLNKLIRRRAHMVNCFFPTKKVGSYLAIDERNKSFQIGGDIFAFSNLLSFELLEDGYTVTKGGLGRAVVGGVLFGEVGAIVGGITGAKKTKGVCDSMKLRVTLREAHVDNTFITFIRSGTPKSSSAYRNAQKNAQACISAFEIIADQEQSEAWYEEPTPSYHSVDDEILQYKQLLDAGAITKEEFDAMQALLLGL